jgi:hypothetical protein
MKLTLRMAPVDEALSGSAPIHTSFAAIAQIPRP